MNIWESIKMAIDSIRVHKLRSFLTMLGIIIGVAAVTVIVAIGQGGTEKLTESFSGAGNTIQLVPKSDDENGTPFVMNNDEIHFTPMDVNELKRIPEVKNVLALSFQTADIRYRKKKLSGTFVYGVNSNAVFEMQNLTFKQGRNFQTDDFLSSSGGVVLSHVVAEKLFQGTNPVGKIVMIGSQPVRVSGVLDKPTGLASLIQTSEVYLPSATWRNIFGKQKIDQLVIEVHRVDQMKAAGDQAVAILNRNHNKEDGYEVQNLEEIMQGIEQIAGIMTIVIGSIGGISLFVGGIGVMNIMLVSVTERTREIGIRKALGATRSNILLQFLIEAITLSVIGGGSGILLAYVVTAILNGFNIWPAALSIPVAFGGVLFSMLFGVVFGILPANKAARLNPIECLRYE